MKGLVYNIQRYSLHDGDGVRTLIFFKGCPLHCPWCSNPESQSNKPELVRIKSKCIHCKTCPYTVEECPSGAMVEFGHYMTINEMMDIVLKDMVFYRTTGGGVTLSGGEVLSQPEFVLELLKELKKLGIHTAIETCGQGSTEALLEIAEYIDIILFDLKMMDHQLAKEVLGADMTIVERNLKTLVAKKKSVIPRVPLVPGYTMEMDNIKAILKLVLELGLKEIHILPLHHYGSSKYEALNMPYRAKDIKVPTENEVQTIKNFFESNGLKVAIGG